MACQNPICMGNYKFDDIVYYAKKRFIEGYNTIDLMAAAKSDHDKKAIALVSLLQVDDDEARDLNLICKHDGDCKALNCRNKLKKMIGEELEFIDGCEYSFV
jgi:hypothetical protein